MNAHSASPEGYVEGKRDMHLTGGLEETVKEAALYDRNRSRDLFVFVPGRPNEEGACGCNYGTGLL